jgi:hypothetical protein
LERVRRKAELKRSKEKRAALYELSKRDPATFIDELCWTHDPRLKAHPDAPTLLPLKLFDFQKDLVNWLQKRLENRESGLVEKSRDTGATWIAAAFAVWLWLFFDEVTIGFGSRKEDLVDKRGDPNCIFYKIRTLIDCLPAWITPQSFELEGDHDNHMRIKNPENGSAIIGEAGDNVGRGGRTLIYFWDETAYHSGARSVESSLSMNTEIVIYISTPNGVGNLFYEKRQSGAIPVKTLHWSDDPRKDREWYEAFKAEYGPTITARELDIEYSASIDGVVIPNNWVQAAAEIDLEWNGTDRHAGLDVADGGADESVYIDRTGPVVRAVSGRKGDPNETTKTARWAIGHGNRNAISRMFVDEVGVGSGVVSTLKDDDPDFDHDGVNVGSAPTNAPWNDEKLRKEVFHNLKAELHWTLRLRFKRTYEHLHGESDHDIRDLISIPDNHDLKVDLSKPLWETDGNGRIKIESKDKLKDRLGPSASPDYLDALVLAYAGDSIGQPLLIG